MAGIDMAFELELYNGTLNTAHYLLHNMVNDAQKPPVEALNKQGKVFFDPAGYRPYTEWVYYSPEHPPSPEEAARCSAGPSNLSSGPFKLPDGSWICFVMDKCHGPFLGAMKTAYSKDGTELEISAPFAGFLRTLDGKNAIREDMVVTVQFSLETSGQLSSTGDWTTDATLPWVYHLGKNQTGCKND